MINQNDDESNHDPLEEAPYLPYEEELSSGHYFNRKRKILYGILGGFLVLFIGIATIAVHLLSPYYKAVQNYDLTHLNDLPTSTILLDRNEEILGYLYTENRIALQSSEIPLLVKNAFIAAEDRRFYQHGALDFRGIARAATINFHNRKIIQGGSTITQQLAKQIIGDTRRVWSRKWKEAFLAHRLEQNFTKDEILTYYLNRVYFGSGYFGLAAASEGYFGKKPIDLTPAEAAIIAGVVRAPSSYSPSRYYERSLKRSALVLDLMEQLKYITLLEKLHALDEKPKIRQVALAGTYNHYRARLLLETEQILELKHREQVPQGLRIFTSLSKDLQNQTEQLLKEESRRVSQEISLTHKDNKDNLEGAAIVLDPSNGEIFAYVGGRNFEKHQYDHLSQARRQPQALLYPWIAGLAIDQLHLSPLSILDSSNSGDAIPFQNDPISLEDKNKMGRGSILLHDSLVYGNQPALLRLAAALGSSPLTAFLKKAKLDLPEQNNENNPLHLSSMTLMEATSLYGALSGTNRVHSPSLIRKIERLNGELLYQAKERPSPLLLTSESLAEIRQALVEKAEEGSGRVAMKNSILETPRALYHAVSDGFLDSSCIGVTPRVAVGVWLGAVDNKQAFANRKQGEEATLPLWTQLIDAAAIFQGKQGAFVRPSQLTEVEFDRRSGQVKGFRVMGKSTGNALVLLTKKQIGILNPSTDSTPQAAGLPVSSWSQWFSNILVEEDNAKTPANPSTSQDNLEIPEKLELLVPGVRGNILTRDNQILATTTKDQALVCTWPAPQEIWGDENILAAVRKRIELSEKELEIQIALTDQEILERYHFRRFQPLELVSTLTPAQVQKVQSSNLERFGLTLQGYPIRSYPQNNSLSHVLGYLRKVQSSNAGRYQAHEVVYDDFGGASGLEALFDEELQGKKGTLVIETREDGFLKRVQMNQPSQGGNSIRLTIDSRWQKSLENSIRSDLPTAGIVMDVRNGDILAMASYPDFNPNHFVPRMTPEVWKQISENAAHPLLNRVYRQQQPPGSIYKIVTTLGAMKAGTLDPRHQVRCNGIYTVGNVVYKVTREQGIVDFRKGMALSFNSYFFDMALHTPREELIQIGKEMGIGQKTGFLLPYEAEGSLPTPESVRMTHNRLMGPGDVANMAIGQGDVLVTPLQMVRMITAVANRGTLFTPRLVSRLEDAEGHSVQEFPAPPSTRIQLDAKNWDILHDSLRAVVTEGTAPSLNMPQVTVAAKTGTAQAGNSKDRQVAWIVGFIPFEKPQIAFAFMMEGVPGKEISGGHHAAPMARKTLESALLAQSATVTEVKAK